MTTLPHCPKCQADATYPDGQLLVCPMCSHEWSAEAASSEAAASDEAVVKDANGNVLADGDTVTLVKELRIKGSNSAIKVGTKVKGIRLNPGSSDGHNIDCKVPGFGPMGLKSEFVKKAK